MGLTSQALRRGLGSVGCGTWLALTATGAASAQPRQLTLAETLATAAAHQPQIRAARAAEQAARARTSMAQTGYLPRVEAQAQYQRSTANFVLSPAFANSPFASSLNIQNKLGPADTVNYFLFGATASETLFDFGRTRAAVIGSEAAADAAAADTDNSAESVALAVRTAYFNTLAAHELVVLADETVANQRKHVAQAAQFVQVGTRPKIDLSSAELVLANAELGLVRARNGESTARLQLASAMGVEARTIANVALAPATIDPLPEEDLPGDRIGEDAVKNRPEYRRATAQMRAQEAEDGSIRSAYLPALVAVGNVSGTKVGEFGAGFNWYVGLGLNWNLSAAVLAGRQLAESNAQLESVAAARESLRLGIVTEVDQQLLAVREAKERLTVADRAIRTAAERRELAEVRYRAGASEILELDDAQVMEANIKAQRVQGQYDLAIARARLVRAMGRKKL